MAIPISEYISSSTKVLTAPVAERDFSGLVFSAVAMKEGATHKVDYDAGKVVTLTSGEVDSCFSDAGFVGALKTYFAYAGGTRRPSVIHLALVNDEETASAALARITNEENFTNFGAFHFYGEIEGINDAAKGNNANEYGWVCIVGTTVSGQAAVAAALSDCMLCHVTHAPMEALAWYASVNYDVAGASGTIDYKQFPGSTPTVTTVAGKAAADALKVNYIGLVQNYGNGMSFYQKGVNMDGTDLGVVRDACWINSQIVREYFALQTSVQKLPANHTGCAMVRNIVVSVAERAIKAGAILIDRPFTASEREMINSYAGNASAADVIASSGYYIAIDIIGNKCQYTLIYAKGDHIQKVEGVHTLV